MFAKTAIATAALAAAVSATDGLPSCWSDCFAKYQISSEGQLCCTETGPIISSCMSMGCSTADATAYDAWVGEYCWVNEGGSTSATSNTWTAPPSTSTVYSTSEITITSCKAEVTDCPSHPESSTEVITTSTEFEVSTTEVCPYIIPTPPTSQTLIPPVTRPFPSDSTKTLIPPVTRPSESGSKTLIPPVTRPSPSGPSTPTGGCCSGPISELSTCEATCKKAHEDCQTAPDSNQAACAASYAACLGYNPYPSGSDSSVQTGCPAPPSSPPSTGHTGGNCCSRPMSEQSNCAADCEKAHNACTAAPDSNKAACAAEQASCLGYNPFPSGSSPNGETGCPAASAPPPPSTGTGHTGGNCCSRPMSEQSDCAAGCEKAHTACQAAEGANMAACAAEQASCLGYNPFPSGSSPNGETGCPAAPAPSPPSTGTGTGHTGGNCCSRPMSEQTYCFADCEKAHTACQAADGANMAACAAQKAACLGYSPYPMGANGTVQTGCSAGPTGGFQTAPAGPTGGVGGGAGGAPPVYPTGNASTSTGGAGSPYPPQQTGNTAASVQVGGLVMLLGAVAALL